MKTIRKKTLLTLLIMSGFCNYIQPYNGNQPFQRVEVDAPIEELNTAIDENDLNQAIRFFDTYSFSSEDINTALMYAINKLPLNNYNPEFLILLTIKGGIFDKQHPEEKKLERILSFDRKIKRKKVETVENLLSLLEKASQENDLAEKAHILYKAVNAGIPLFASEMEFFKSPDIVESPETYEIINSLKNQIYNTFAIKEGLSPDIYEDESLTGEDDWEFIDRQRIKSDTEAAEEDFEKELEEWEIVSGDAYRDYYNLPRTLEFD